IASFGTGTASHLSGEMFKMMAGVQMLHVPYRGSAPMLTDLLAGQVQVAFDNLPASIEHIKAGRLPAVAIPTARRAETTPDTPAPGKRGPGWEPSRGPAPAAPAGTRAGAIARLNTETNAARAAPAVRAKLEPLGAGVLGGSAAEAAALVAEDTERWAKVVKFSG